MGLKMNFTPEKSYGMYCGVGYQEFMTRLDGPFFLGGLIFT
jgi:hypothetical protein